MGVQRALLPPMTAHSPTPRLARPHSLSRPPKAPITYSQISDNHQGLELRVVPATQSLGRGVPCQGTSSENDKQFAECGQPPVGGN